LCPSSAALKKTKLAEENRALQTRSIEDCFFIYVNAAAVCIVCNENISVSKEYNIKKYYETKYEDN
jgi:hypothetical protein